jgi:very-short-patch-repair endonuclease
VRTRGKGWTILRFWNDDILRRVDDVCQHIVTAAGLVAADAAIQGRASSPEMHR